MKIDNLNEDEKFALKVLKVSAVVLVFLSAILVALSVCASTISQTDCQPSGATKVCLTL